MNVSSESVKSLTSRLLTVLEEELRMLNELAEYSEEKTKMLLKSDIEGLGKLLAAEEEAVEDLHYKEKERIKCTAQLALSLGVAPEECRLKTLPGYMDDDDTKRKLGDIRQRLKTAAGRLTRCNKKAEALAGQKAGYTEFLINMFYSSRAQGGPELYDGQGKLNGKADYGRHDFTV